MWAMIYTNINIVVVCCLFVYYHIQTKTIMLAVCRQIPALKKKKNRSITLVSRDNNKVDYNIWK